MCSSDLILGILTRFGALSRPTVMNWRDPYDWFDGDFDATYDAMNRLIRAGAITYRLDGEMATFTVCRDTDRVVAVPETKPEPTPETPKKKRQRKEVH